MFNNNNNKKTEEDTFGEKDADFRVAICIWAVHATLPMEVFRRQLNMKSEVQKYGLPIQMKGLD